MIIHFFITVALIVVVLLQSDKGEGLSGAFGGGASQAMFGSHAEGAGITKLTTGIAIAFMITSLCLAYMSKSVKSDVKGFTPRPASAPNPAEMPDLGM